MATGYLEHTVGTPDTNGNKKGTFSAWVKRSKLGTEQAMYVTRTSGTQFVRFRFDSDKINVTSNTSGTNYYATTDAVYRDTSAWYHIVVAYDTTQATSANRIRIYVNGVEQSKSASNYPSQNATIYLLASGQPQRIGANSSDAYFDGVMTHVHYTEGYAYAATDFGETDSTSGIWVPKTAPSVTYGTNGFFLKFENSAAMGTDSSGQSNTFTVNNSVTQNVDSPTNNFPTLNRSAPSQDNRTGGNGSLYTGDNSNNSWSSHPATMACESGKWYFEIKDESDWGSTSDSTRRYGIVNLGVSVNQNRASATDVRFSDTTSAYAYMNASGVRTGGSTIGGSTGTHPTFAEGDFIMVAMDLDNLKLYFGKNGTWLDSGNPASGASGTGAVATLAAGAWAAYLEVKYGSDTASINFGQGYFRTAVAGTNADANGHGKFKYSVPSGYYAICTKNIKEFG